MRSGVRAKARVDVRVGVRYRAGMPGRDDRRRGRPAAHELARYEALFAARTRGMKSSAMREMMALTERPDVISLAGGLPDTSTFAPELYAKLMSQVAVESTARALQYGPTEGMAAAVQCIVEVMAEEQTVVDPANVIVTTGGQQVIDLVCKALIDPGDVIVAEAPTYPGAVPTFGAYQADVVQIEMDSDGMPIDELESVLDRLAGEGRRPKFIYTIPNFQNPGGVTMSLPRRRRLVEVARERELLVLEDNPYGLLRYEGEPLPTLYSLDAQNGGPPTRGVGGTSGAGGDGISSDLVIYLGTFSKILSPGLRLGWAVAPRAVLEKLNLGKQGADLCSSPMTQLFVSAYFAERGTESHPPRPAWIEYVERLRDLYRRRRDVMLESLAEHFGGRASWTRPEGGLFIWATLDGDIDTTDLLARALKSEGVAFVPGRAAFVDGLSGASSMRLNFAGTPDREIREGIRRIGEVVREQVGLFGSETGAPPPGPSHGGAAGAETADGDRVRTTGTPTDAERAGTGDDDSDMADVFELPRRAGERQGRRSQGR
jgi:2-aminoadipate transaminase